MVSKHTYSPVNAIPVLSPEEDTSLQGEENRLDKRLSYSECAFTLAIRAFAVFGAFSLLTLHDAPWIRTEEGGRATEDAVVDTNHDEQYEAYKRKYDDCLNNVSYSQVVESLISEYDCTDPADITSVDEIMYDAIWAMDIVEDDGVPMAVPGHPYLYIGSIGAAYNRTGLEQENISFVVNMYASEIKSKHTDIIEYVNVYGIHDNPKENIQQHFEGLTSFIEKVRQSGGKVLVHCWGGQSRSATIILAYLIRYHGMSYHQALVLLRSRRKQVQPNDGYVTQLKSYHRAIANTKTEETEQGNFAGSMAHNLTTKGHLISMRKRRTFIVHTRRKPAAPVKLTFLSNIPFSVLERALLTRYGVNEAGSDMYHDESYEKIMGALQAMGIVEMDGHATPLKHHRNLFVGSIGAAYNPDELFRQGISHTVSLTRLAQEKFPDFISSKTEPDIVTTDPNIVSTHFPSLLDSMHDIVMEGGKILIHGWRDKTSSVAVVVAYAMTYQDMDCESALQLVPGGILESTSVRCAVN